ncbi:DUF2891 domain-containing protein [Pontixanthobacter aestiaquae]|uniref:DUF2891 family protein n=1 Tax=Pontixanthobacter aestiaquae TaxID=1509367 RepID=A0A844Z7D8_9SPHN|nr:DUF2891 domain-containing protein [Pontixanthobacter aestiaquae]MDN3646215.1 DUF2891 domain-containing protein [Pontixanthobacter aestiaquae]MXO82793.1 DUF2891 family protein [Pontixanthobacter aestiaquae]
MELTEKIARGFARIALGHVSQEYPRKLDHVMNADADVLPPRVLHPCFFGSFDWHSCVHGWWTLLTLRRLYPDMPAAAQIGELAETTLSEDKLAAELDYLSRPGSAGFERPYGWAWLLYLHLEAVRHEDQAWGQRLEPLARAFAKRLESYLAILTYPIRTGTHFNSAFALTLAVEWADQFDPDLAETVRGTAKRWFGEDRGCQAWEPGGDEFLSPALSVALLMQKSLPADMFAGWFGAFLPDLSNSQPATLFKPATVSDRSDGKVAHLDGLNLSRAWAWREIGQAVPEHAVLAERLAKTHLDAAMPHVAGDYAGEHWLASFALLALMGSSQ